MADVDLVYGLTSPHLLTPPHIQVNRFGADYGNLVWQISADYRQDGRPLVTVHTILRRKVMSAIGDKWVESGLREAKGLVAADLGAPMVSGMADRPWETTTLSFEGADRPAEKLTTNRGVGWVLELQTAVIGLIGFDSARDAIGRIGPAAKMTQ